ncbi:MAG: cystathionine gamma-synthase [Chloroflexi bacterium]|nr:cystathionine gamma-synthase [Chloroflexota bacterium]
MTDSKPYRFATRAIHAGQSPDPATGAIITPIYQTSTFVQDDLGQHKGYEYARTGNPTRTAMEQCLAELEGARYALGFASGMAAIATTMYLLKQGDHVVAGDDAYGGTYRLFTRVLSQYGLEFTFTDLTDLQKTKAALRPNTRMIWLETPTNPLLKIFDIAGIARLAAQMPTRPIVVVDNTFASPYLQQPLALGADLVVHSTTKYIGGHSDVIGGAVIMNDEELHRRLKFLQNAAGAVPGPHDAWLTLRGMKTLALRMDQHGRNALAVARFLEDHPQVTRVIYPGLESHPQHELAQKQMRNFGGMVSFEVQGGAEAARAVVTHTRLFALAESLGGVESLIEMPAAMTHLSVQGSPLEVPAGLIRLSVGIEDEQDLIEDLAMALAR